MNPSIFLIPVCAIVMSGFGFTFSDVNALSCEIDEQGNCISFPEISSPLKQYKHGVSIADIFCHNSYLVIKTTTGEPACVINDKKLIERGWAVTLDDFIKNGPDVEIILDQVRCFGTCPIYKITITNDGTLVFEGIEYLDTVGVETNIVSVSDVARLISYVEKIDYFSLENPPDPPISDIPRIVTVVTIGENTNEIVNIQGEYGIKEVAELELMIKVLANTQNRIDSTTSTTEELTKSKISTFYIDSKLVDCVGVAPQQCMLVKENANSEWLLFYDFIEGFEYKEGTEYKINVAVTEIENPPADASSLKYTLIEILNPVPNSCGLEPDPGLCKAYLPKYYFDETSNSCQEFIWGGCNGVVPFETLSECQLQCNLEN